MRPQRKVFPLMGNNERHKPKPDEHQGKWRECKDLGSYAGWRFPPRFPSACEHVPVEDEELDVSVWTCCLLDGNLNMEPIHKRATLWEWISGAVGWILITALTFAFKVPLTFTFQRGARREPPLSSTPPTENWTSSGAFDNFPSLSSVSNWL